MEHNLQTVNGYDALSFSGYSQFYQEATGCLMDGEAPPQGLSAEQANAACLLSPRWSWLALLNVRYVVVPAQMHIPTGFTLQASDGDFRLYQSPTPSRASIARFAAQTAPGSGCVERLKSIDIGQTVLLNEPVQLSHPGNQVTILGSEQGRDWQQLSVQANGDSILIRPSAWALGWKAWMDGAPVDVLQADCALQGIFLTSGTHEVTFRYVPGGYTLGKWISLGFAVLLLILGGGFLLRQRWLSRQTHLALREESRDS